MNKSEVWETHHKHIFMGSGKFDNKHGVGIMLNKRWRQRIIDTEYVNERAITTTILVNRQHIKFVLSSLKKKRIITLRRCTKTIEKHMAHCNRYSKRKRKTNWQLSDQEKMLETHQRCRGQRHDPHGKRPQMCHCYFHDHHASKEPNHKDMKRKHDTVKRERNSQTAKKHQYWNARARKMIPRNRWNNKKSRRHKRKRSTWHKRKDAKAQVKRENAAAAEADRTLEEAEVQKIQRRIMKSSSTEANQRGVPALIELWRQDGWTSTPCVSDDIRKDSEYDKTAGERLLEQRPHSIEKYKDEAGAQEIERSSTTSSSVNTRRRRVSALFVYRRQDV